MAKKTEQEVAEEVVEAPIVAAPVEEVDLGWIKGVHYFD